MEYANCMVALAGERDNTVPKYCISTAEIAVLRAIHGDDSIHDIEPCDPPKDADGRTISVRNRDEMVRLKEAYASPNSTPLIEKLFPGIAARVPETLDELDLDDSLFKPRTRAIAGERGAAPEALESRRQQAEERGDGITPIRDEHADHSVLD